MLVSVSVDDSRFLVQVVRYKLGIDRLSRPIVSFLRLLVSVLKQILDSLSTMNYLNLQSD